MTSAIDVFVALGVPVTVTTSTILIVFDRCADQLVDYDSFITGTLS